MCCAVPVTLKPLLPVTKPDGGEVMLTIGLFRYAYSARPNGLIAVSNAMPAMTKLILSALVHFSLLGVEILLRTTS